jgi:hypothetical protein
VQADEPLEDTEIIIRISLKNNLNKNMSILDLKIDLKLNKTNNKKVEYPLSEYHPTDMEQKIRSMIINHFRIGDMTMRKPRREFNDLSVLTRLAVDQMLFNAYQPNNGEALEGDEINVWRSRAMKPIVRNKCISIAAHATARLIFPKLFAYNEQSEQQLEAATTMEDLMEWSAQQCDYEKTSLYAVISAMYNPASLVYTEYSDFKRDVKRKKDGGGYEIESIVDEDLSGFKDTIVPVDEFYISNFYEHDVQKQDWVIWRRIQSYDTMNLKYGKKYDNFKYVKPGMQVIFSDDNLMFYEVYDTNLRQELCEEVLYWNKGLDIFQIVVNGILLTDPENCNPRYDKRYPFVKFGYELIDEGKCFYYKSLAFKMQQDANIVNTLYPMIIDGTYLSIMPPMINRGGEAIGSEVIVPGAVTTLSDKDANLQPIVVSQNLSAGLTALQKVEESVSESSQEPRAQGISTPGSQTAFEISKLEQNANTVLGLFVKMISQFVKEYGRLRLGDILQYLTIADADNIIDNSELLYKTFLLPNKQSGGKEKTRKIKFDMGVPSEPIGEEEVLAESYKVLEEEDESDDKVEIYKANPELFRKLKYMIMVSPDVINPKSEDLERALNLEVFDRAIQLPFTNQEILAKDLLFGSYDKTKKDVNRYIKQEGFEAPVGGELPPPIPGQVPKSPPAITPQNVMSGNPLANVSKRQQKSLV